MHIKRHEKNQFTPLKREDSMQHNETFAKVEVKIVKIVVKTSHSKDGACKKSTRGHNNVSMHFIVIILSKIKSHLLIF